MWVLNKRLTAVSYAALSWHTVRANKTLRRHEMFKGSHTAILFPSSKTLFSIVMHPIYDHIHAERHSMIVYEKRANNFSRYIYKEVGLFVLVDAKI